MLLGRRGNAFYKTVFILGNKGLYKTGGEGVYYGLLPRYGECFIFMKRNPRCLLDMFL